MTPEQVHDELSQLRVEIQKQFLEFTSEMLKAFGDFKADLIKTIWITQLSAIGIILIGIGLLIRFLH